MNQRFPPHLIAKCQNLIREEAGIEITENEAEIYIEKLGRLMLSLVKIHEEKINFKQNNGKNHPN